MTDGNLKLESTRNPKVITEILKQNHAAWGGKLSVEEYLTRESLLQSTAFAQENLTTFVFLNENNEILSSCEVYKRPAHFNGKSGFCYAIASVFTPERHRRNGYAKAMLTRLAPILKAEPNSLGSTLYSDIGPKFYNDLGWKFHPSISFIHNLSSSYNPSSTAALLKNPDVPQILSKFNSDCISSAKPNEFYTLPSPQSHEWLLARSTYYSKAFGLDTVENVGARVGIDFVTWFHDFKEEKLMITLASIRDLNNAQVLLDAAIVEAKRWNMLIKVEMWDPSEEMQSKLKEWEVIKRTDSLSSLMTFESDHEPVLWRNNEKFAWV